jgi:hypothetical protein
MLSIEDAQRGVYIDFEGSRTEPALLGTVFFDKDQRTVVYLHYILDEALWPACPLEPGCTPSTIIRAAASLLGHSIDRRSIYAWSEYEAQRLQELLADSPMASVADLVVNARPIAEEWKKRRHPHHFSHGLPKGQRNALSDYLDLIGYDRYSDAADKPAEGITEMLRALRRDDRRVSESVRAAWRATLHRNFDDCDGLRELMVRVAAET